jgi:hypothetical protein
MTDGNLRIHFPEDPIFSDELQDPNKLFCLCRIDLHVYLPTKN